MPAFLAPVDYAVGLTAITLNVGDFNGDAVLDLATANAKYANRLTCGTHLVRR